MLSTGIVLSIQDQLAYPLSKSLLVLLILAISVILFFAVRLLLREKVFNKLRLIYKIISDTKSPGKNTDIQSLEHVNKEVARWAVKTNDEIENLKSLESYRKEYLGNVAHELKTPIFTIQGYLHTLIEGGLYDEKVNQKYLKKALQNVDRLETIIGDLDNITRLEQDTELKYSNFDIKILIQECLEDLEVHRSKKNIKIHFVNNKERSFLVKADKEWIRQVILNLVINAIKYGKENGNIEIKLYDLEDQNLVEISDDGIGIEEEHLKHLFDRFYRIDSSRSRKSGGSGLGLSIVKHIVEAHGQSINVRSTPNIGSTFGFTLKKV